MAKNHYDTLGVSKSATADEIKKAYRKEALKYHPDRNQGNKDAETKFKAAAEAYEILGDEKKRKSYNVQIDKQQYSHSNSKQYAYDTFYKQGWAHVPIGDDIKLTTKVNLSEIVNGVKKTFKIKKKRKCLECEGTGKHTDVVQNKQDSTNCNICNGIFIIKFHYYI